MKDFQTCSVYRVIQMINGKWKPFIMFLLSQESHTFNEIWRRIPKVSKKVLSSHLKELMRDELIQLKESKYGLSARGESLSPVLLEMNNWSLANLEDVVGDTESVLLPKT